MKLLQEIPNNGNVKTFNKRYPLGQLNQIFRNNGDGKFENISNESGDTFRNYYVSRGVSFGDIDNDGDTDLLVINNNGKAELLQNNLGNHNNWIGLKLLGNTTKRDMLGSKVEVFINKKTSLRRRVKTDGSYSSARDPRVLVGLGKNEKIEKVRVTWIGGKTEEWKNFPINSYSTLTKGTSNIKVKR